MKPNSCAFRPCGETAESVPKAIFTPIFTARRNISSWAANAAFALAATGGGKRSSLPPVHCPAMQVGTRNVPFDFMRARVSSVRNEPCSIESMPASTAVRAATSPCACAAVLRFRRCASSMIAVSSSSVSCGAATSSPSDSTPPEAHILMTSAPYLMSRRTAWRPWSAPWRIPFSMPGSGPNVLGGNPVLSQWPPVAPRA